MKFLVVHNSYSDITGEDLLIQTLNACLRRSPDFEVVEYRRASADFHKLPFFRKLRWLVAGNLPFRVPQDFKDLLDRDQPDIALIHNTIPLINPWILTELKQRGIPVLGSIYNYRLLCPRGTCVRDEQFCDLCHRRTPVWAVIFNCLGNRLFSLIYAYRYCVHGHLLKHIDAFICSVQYRARFLQERLPRHKVHFVVHHIGVDPALVESSARRDRHVLFAGRFVHDKGVRIVLECARRLPQIPFEIHGEGPLEPMCRRFIREKGLTNVILRPWAPHDQILRHLRQARIFIFPSIYREFGRVLCEAMLLKTPVVVARNAVSETLIRSGENGFLFDPKDTASLVTILGRVWPDDELLGRVGQQASREVRHYNDLDFCIRQIRDVSRNIKNKTNVPAHAV